MTHWADCASNISHDKSSLRWCHPPKTNIEDAEDATARELRGVCIDAAGAASPVSKLTTLTLLQSGVFPPPMMYNLPEMKQNQTTVPNKMTSLLVVYMLLEVVYANQVLG